MAKLDLITSSTRPAAPAAGKAYFETDTNKVIIWDGSAWTEIVSDTAPAFSNAYSVEFDGSNDYMDLGTNTTYVNSSNAFSISSWFNVDLSASFPTICNLRTNLTKTFVIGSHDTTGANAVYNGIFFGSSSPSEFKGFATNNSTLSAALTSGWHHVLLTYDGVSSTSSSSFNVYVDGVGYTANTGVGLAAASDVNYVGKAAFQFKGLIDEFAIFDSELSSSDATDIYNSGVPASLTSYSPVGWWRMGDNDSGTGTTITDQGSGSNDGTLTNGPTFSSSVPS